MKPKVVYSDRAESAARNAARIQETTEAVASVLADLPEADNEPGIDFGLSAGEPGLQSKEHSGGVNINPNEVADLGTARTSVSRSAE